MFVESVPVCLDWEAELLVQFWIQFKEPTPTQKDQQLDKRATKMEATEIETSSCGLRIVMETLAEKSTGINIVGSKCSIFELKLEEFHPEVSLLRLESWSGSARQSPAELLYLQQHGRRRGDSALWVSEPCF
ncbi:hypothetical protein GOODEAATRI_024395 [Goodea atripinnis]|uniref:Uncharacterized protein n=1 Tax=Goodea atripinnis TaxID=208336 RepID=A0ABV0NMU7_9TELE